MKHVTHCTYEDLENTLQTLEEQGYTIVSVFSHGNAIVVIYE